MTTRRRRGQVVPFPRLFVHRLIFFPLFFAPRRHEVEEEATQRRGGGEVALVPARSCDAIFCSPLFAPLRHDDEEEARSPSSPSVRVAPFFVPLFLLPDDTMLRRRSRGCPCPCPSVRRRRHDDEEEARSPSSPPVRAVPFLCSPFFSPRRHDVEEEATRRQGGG